MTNGPAGTPGDCRVIFREIVRGSAKAIQDNHKPAIAADAEAIHTMRIELTRLRAAALFFKPWVAADTEWAPVNDGLAWLNSALGRTRNCDVTVQYADRKRYRHWAGQSRRVLLRSQDRAHRRLAEELRSARYRQLMSALRSWLAKTASQDGPKAASLGGNHDYCEERLRQWREKLNRKGRHIGALRRKQLHLIRIRSKHYRYMVDSLLKFGMTVSRRDLAFSETLKRVHQSLGELRDLRRLRKSIGERPPRYRRRQRQLMSRVERSFRRNPSRA